MQLMISFNAKPTVRHIKKFSIERTVISYSAAYGTGRQITMSHVSVNIR